MKEENIEILKDTEVTNIITADNKITGLKLNNSKEIKADNVICNADPPAVYSKLIKSKNTNPIFNWKIKRMEYSMGLFVYYFGTKKTYDAVEIIRSI